jgi:hypothetical protein
MMKRVFLISACAVVGFMLLVAVTLFVIDAPCPILTAGAGGPWFKPYHAGENPWIGAWTRQGTWPPASDVATGDARQRKVDHTGSMGVCKGDAPDAKAKLAS